MTRILIPIAAAACALAACGDAGNGGGTTVRDSAGVEIVETAGSIDLPPRFRPFEVAGGEVIGRQRDELDVETLVVYPIEKEQQ